MNSPCDKTVPLLRVRGLTVVYRRPHKALRDVSLEVAAGSAFGVCGESGSGKSTLVRALLGLVPFSQGEIAWRGRSMACFGAPEWRQLRRIVQPVFQDPRASLDPRMRVRAILDEPLRVHRRDVDRAARDLRIATMMAQVGLAPALLSRYPHELSGGQCQRVCIARAMILEPEVLVCDEPVSSLDVSIQAQIVALLQHMHRETGTGLVFVSHNLALIRRLCTHMVVLQRGAIVEAGPTQEVMREPRHAYTRRLIDSVPRVPGRASGG